MTTPPEHACCLCGAREDLVADEHVEELFTCRRCLERAAIQDQRIREELDDEPEVEM